jgi:hypothetical protein
MRWNALPIVLLTPAFAAGLGVSAMLERLDPAVETRRREVAEERVVRLERMLEEKDLVLAMLEDHGGVNIASIVQGPPVPAIAAKVAAVKNEVNPALVLLSVGSDDKVEKGFHFSVYRGSEFIGKVVVEKVLRDSCGCRVLFTKTGASIAPGDAAATRLQ